MNNISEICSIAKPIPKNINLLGRCDNKQCLEDAYAKRSQNNIEFQQCLSCNSFVCNNCIMYDKNMCILCNGEIKHEFCDVYDYHPVYYNMCKICGKQYGYCCNSPCSGIEQHHMFSFLYDSSMGKCRTCPNN